MQQAFLRNFPTIIDACEKSCIFPSSEDRRSYNGLFYKARVGKDHAKDSCLFRCTREKTLISSFACTRRHVFLPYRGREDTCISPSQEKTHVSFFVRARWHASLPSRVREVTRLFLRRHAYLRLRAREGKDPHETFLLEAPFGQWRIKTYLFDESIRVIRAADGVHEARHLLHVPQPGIFTAVTALVQENRRCVGLLSRGRRWKVTCGRDHRVVWIISLHGL